MDCLPVRTRTAGCWVDSSQSLAVCCRGIEGYKSLFMYPHYLELCHDNCKLTYSLLTDFIGAIHLSRCSAFQGNLDTKVDKFGTLICTYARLDEELFK